jgi:hypothetical protein
MWKHTNKPWVVGDPVYISPASQSMTSKMWQVNLSKRGLIFITVHGYNKDEVVANAKLVSTSPEILELLELAIPYVEESEEYNFKAGKYLSTNIKKLIEKAGTKCQHLANTKR